MENSQRFYIKIAEYFKNIIKFSHVSFRSIFIVTNSDEVYEFNRFTFSENKQSLIALSDDKSLIQSIIKESLMEELCYKGIIDFKRGMNHMMARTINGKVYSWGSNACGVLGNGQLNNPDDSSYRPQLNKYLNDTNIIDISCGPFHSLVLTIDGEVYGWGFNREGQVGVNSNDDFVLIPTLVKGFDGQKIESICCGGFSHSIALTKTGDVFYWGINQIYGSLESYNSPKFLELNEITVQKISCSAVHSFLLSKDKDIYVLHMECKHELCFGPQKLNNTEKFTDISSHFDYDLFVALSENGLYYIWGKYFRGQESGSQYFNHLTQTDCNSFNDVFESMFGYNTKPIEGRIIRFNDSFIRNGRFSEFNIEKVLGEGSYGVVYKVNYYYKHIIDYCNRCQKHHSSNKMEIFAIKEIKFKNSQKREFFKELETSEFITKLNHKNVVKYLDLWLEEESSFLNIIKDKENTLKFFIKMELCDISLSDLIKEIDKNSLLKNCESLTPLGYYILCEIFIQILEGVNYLHKQKPQIIHRDLRPDNILLKIESNECLVKICDFGLVAFHRYAEQLHSPDRGDLSYAAPEVLDSEEYDIRADIYSLGKVLQELMLIDMNSENENNKYDSSILKSKYKNISLLCDGMTRELVIERPVNCDQILKDKHLWTLSLSEFESQKELEKFFISKENHELYVYKIFKLL